MSEWADLAADGQVVHRDGRFDSRARTRREARRQRRASRKKSCNSRFRDRCCWLFLLRRTCCSAPYRSSISCSSCWPCASASLSEGLTNGIAISRCCQVCPRWSLAPLRIRIGDHWNRRNHFFDSFSPFALPPSYAQKRNVFTRARIGSSMIEKRIAARYRIVCSM